MITELHKSVAALAVEELSRARSIHGEYFTTVHDGYGVLAEEIQEAQDDLNEIAHIRERLLRNIRYNNDRLGAAGCIDLEEIQGNAINAACELIQVAAMATKMLESDAHGRAENNQQHQPEPAR